MESRRKRLPFASTTFGLEHSMPVAKANSHA